MYCVSSLISALKCLDEQCNDGESNPHVEGKCAFRCYLSQNTIKAVDF